MSLNVSCREIYMGMLTNVGCCGGDPSSPHMTAHAHVPLPLPLELWHGARSSVECGRGVATVLCALCSALALHCTCTGCYDAALRRAASRGGDVAGELGS